MSEISAVQIVEKIDGSYVLNTDALNRILQKKDVLNKKVAVLTVAGAFRKGKSFLLSNCVRYLQCKRDGNDWMDPSASITGFTWRQSKDSVTEGILMWPEPFIAVNSSGEEFAILLVDTEGAFDHKSTMSQCATVFALAALLSSVLTYNVMQDIQEDTLNHLEFFASYGSYALDKEDGTSPFQSLLFLIRDWQNDNEYGIEAGRRLLDDKFKSHSSSTQSMRDLRDNIKRSFTDMKCFLLPFPGSKIIKGSEGAITVNDMDEDFRDCLKELIPRMFGTLMCPKKIGGMAITGAEFQSFFETYAKIFASGKVPEPKSIFEATAEATHQAAFNVSINHYSDAMETSFSQLTERQFFEDSKLLSIHEGAKSAALQIFAETRKMGSIPHFLYSLTQRIEEEFSDIYQKDNQTRIMIETTRKEKEDIERETREQDARHARELESMKSQMASEKRSREEAERRGKEETKRLQEKLEREKKDRDEKEREMIKEQKRELETFERQMNEKAEKEKRELERETEKIRKQMEQIQLDNERKEAERQRELEKERQRAREAEKEKERRDAEHKRELERERERAREAQREAREEREARSSAQPFYSHYTPSFESFSPTYSNENRSGTPSGRPRGRPPGKSFSPTYSNENRSGTPSGRPRGRPPGSTAQRWSQGKAPSPGATQSWNLLRREGYID